MAINTVLNIDNMIGESNRGKNRIMYVGVELEGVWETIPKGMRIVKDTSVKNFPAKLINKVAESGNGGIGEISSPPMFPAMMETWMKKNYPQHINATCGLHIHMSFASCSRYSTLMDIRYHDTLLHYIGEWAKQEGFSKDHLIWDRLKGESIYCQKKFWPDKQVLQREKIYDKQKEGHRYTILNFCHGLLGTMEVRVLPMMNTPEQSARALQLIMDVTNACLVKLTERRKRFREELNFAGSSSQFVDRTATKL